MSPEACPALVLNTDYRPLSYFPLSVWHWQDGVRAVFLDRVNVLNEYEQAIHSPSFTMRLPSVVALKQYVQPARFPAFTRFHLFLRDSFTCQYCGAHGTVQDLTFDHVMPRSRGGQTTWDNVVTACARCNLGKGGRTPREAGMALLRRAFRPTVHELRENGRAFPPNFLHESWRDYLYWDVELDA